MNLTDFAGLIGLIADTLSLPALLIAGYYYFIGRHRHERRLLERTRKQPGTRPAVLIISCLTAAPIDNEVRHFLASTEGLKNIEAEKRIESVQLTERSVEPADMPELARQLREAYGRLSGTGYDVLHIFCAAPMPVAMLAGAVLANRGDVRLYHKSKTAAPKPEGGAAPTYDHWGKLNY